MAMSFMNAITQIEELVSKKDQILERAASLVAEAVLDRIYTGDLDRNTERDIKNAIRNFSAEEQATILLKVIMSIGMNKTGSKKNDNNHNGRSNKIKKRSDLFGGYND